MPRLPNLPPSTRFLDVGSLAVDACRCSTDLVRLTTERKVCAGVLSLAVIALGVDRLFLGGGITGPASASASVSGSETSVAVAPENPRPSLTRAITTVPVAKQLAVLQTAVRDADAFAPPARWQQAMADARAAEEARTPRAEAREQRDPRVARFQRHQLTAVLSEQGIPTKALIRVAEGESGRSYSKLFAIGDELEGLRLMEMISKPQQTSATFVDGAGSLLIQLELPVIADTSGIRSSASPNKLD
jgi:hypothetical protein